MSDKWNWFFQMREQLVVQSHFKRIRFPFKLKCSNEFIWNDSEVLTSHIFIYFSVMGQFVFVFILHRNQNRMSYTVSVSIVYQFAVRRMLFAHLRYFHVTTTTIPADPCSCSVHSTHCVIFHTQFEYYYFASTVVLSPTALCAMFLSMHAKYESSFNNSSVH